MTIKINEATKETACDPGEAKAMVTMLPLLTPLEFGLLSGLIHHFATQYPNQADVFMTLSAFGLSNVLYAVLWMMSGDPGVICSPLIGRFVRDLVLFNAVYV